MNTKYPALADMGITSPEQIYRFSLQASGNSDILRVIFRREKGSLLSGSNKFKFRRLDRTIEQDGGSKKNETISEVSPALSRAIAELHTIVNKKHSLVEQKEIIVDEIARLEEEVHSRITYLKSLIKKLDD